MEAQLFQWSALVSDTTYLNKQRYNADLSTESQATQISKTTLIVGFLETKPCSNNCRKVKIDRSKTCIKPHLFLASLLSGVLFNSQRKMDPSNFDAIRAMLISLWLTVITCVLKDEDNNRFPIYKEGRFRNTKCSRTRLSRSLTSFIPILSTGDKEKLFESDVLWCPGAWISLWISI